MSRNFTNVVKFYYNGVATGYNLEENGFKKFFPISDDNKDYVDLQEWIAEGNSVIDNPPEGNE
jgi:hypothetical protein